MSIKALTDALAQTVGADVAGLEKTAGTLAANQGDLTALSTTERGSLVGALNELKTGLSSLGDETLSSVEVQEMVQAGINGVVAGAPNAFDTLKEISDYISQDQTAYESLIVALNKRVRVDEAQNFTAEEQNMGRSNIGAASQADHTALSDGVGDHAAANFVAEYNAGKASVA